MKKTFGYILLVAFVIIIAVFTHDKNFTKDAVEDANETSPSLDQSRESTIADVKYKITEVASGLKVSWSIVFPEPNRILFTERPGRISVIKDGVLASKPLRTFSEVSSTGEEGIMGLALDPDYSRNKYVYTSLAYKESGKMYVKVVRLKDEGESFSGDITLIDKIPAASNHAGSKLKFGPDKKLYITTGDATNKDLPQNTSSLGGKILRINSDGGIPSDNPFPNNPVWSYGHRNPQGIAWTLSGDMYETEHGPSGFDGPGGGDEINFIKKGANYGWPLVSHEKTKDGTEKPLRIYTPAVAPSGLMAYSGKLFPQFKNNLFFGALKGRGVYRLVVDDNNPSAIISSEKISDISYGRIREVIEAPDGSIYFSTSNEDGRGDPAKTDDRIFRIVPEK